MAQNRMWWFCKKKGFEGVGVQPFQVEEEWEDMLFGPQPKAGAPVTVEDNPIEISDEGDD